MKVAIGTLLFTFVVFFNSIELSSQSSSSSGSTITNDNDYVDVHVITLDGGNPPGVRISRFERLQGDVRLINAPNLPTNAGYRLPNGRTYMSNGIGPIRIIYNTQNRIAAVHQGGRPAVFLAPARPQSGPRNGSPIRPPQNGN